jgi:hypothetical protein
MSPTLASKTISPLFDLHIIFYNITILNYLINSSEYFVSKLSVNANSTMDWDWNAGSAGMSNHMTRFRFQHDADPTTSLDHQILVYVEVPGQGQRSQAPDLARQCNTN